MSSIYGREEHRSRYTATWPHSPTDPAVLATALGIVALARRPSEVEPLLRAGVPRLTPYTGAHPRQVMTAMRRFADSGAVVEHQGCVLGWSCLAVPVPSSDGAGVKAVLGVVNRSPRFHAARYLPLARASADEIAAEWLSPNNRLASNGTTPRQGRQRNPLSP